jgi:thioredoxin 1
MEAKKPAEATRSTVDLTTETFFLTVKRQGIALVDWWAGWCGPCRAFAPIYARVAARHPDIVFAKIDTEAEGALASAFHIRSIPTLMAFRDGILLFAQPGMLPESAIEELVKHARTLDMNAVRERLAETRATDDDPAGEAK